MVFTSDHIGSTFIALLEAGSTFENYTLRQFIGRAVSDQVLKGSVWGLRYQFPMSAVVTDRTETDANVPTLPYICVQY